MAIDQKRRNAVMRRSIKLGHCVCEPHRACPCDIFKEYNVCTCAGEKMPVKTKTIALTHYVRKAGCASKIGQADLNRLLGTLPPVTDPNVVIGVAAGDDAGIYQLADRYNLVMTVDVFTPCVDDAYLFGQIAAANSVSDVYAMGGKPITALSIVGFPIEELDGSIMEAMLRGGMDKLAEAGCSLIGGHSINDAEIKCGFAVTGLIDKNRIVHRDAARPGDVLVLTKPLGTGIVCFAAQIGRIDQQSLNEVGQSMATLNKDAAELLVEHKAHACTDVTGFGLMGHLVEMIRGSNVSAEVDMSRLPVFAAVEPCLKNDILPGAIESNQEYSQAWVRLGEAGSEENLPILYDPQTSGGLLIALPQAEAHVFVEKMIARGHTSTSIIGRIIEKDTQSRNGKVIEGRVIIVNSKLGHLIGDPKTVTLLSKEEAGAVVHEKELHAASLPEKDESCCASPPSFESFQEGTVHSASSSSERSETRSLKSKELFADFLKEVNKEGLVDKRTKKLMAIALSIARHCKPCLITHIKSATTMGISKAEIDEAAYVAISFAGAPAMMFYNEVCKEIGI